MSENIDPAVFQASCTQTYTQQPTLTPVSQSPSVLVPSTLNASPGPPVYSIIQSSPTDPASNLTSQRYQLINFVGGTTPILSSQPGLPLVQSVPLNAMTPTSPAVPKLPVTPQSPPKKKRGRPKKEGATKQRTKIQASNTSASVDHAPMADALMDDTAGQTKRYKSWVRTKNEDNKSALALIVEWLGKEIDLSKFTPMERNAHNFNGLLNYSLWKGLGGLRSKKDIAEEIAKYIALNGLPGFDGKGVETKVCSLFFVFNLLKLNVN